MPMLGALVPTTWQGCPPAMLDLDSAVPANQDRRTARDNASEQALTLVSNQALVYSSPHSAP
jgi:hypothetical protein